MFNSSRIMFAFETYFKPKKLRIRLIIIIQQKAKRALRSTKTSKVFNIVTFYIPCVQLSIFSTYRKNHSHYTFFPHILEIISKLDSWFSAAKRRNFSTLRGSYPFLRNENFRIRFGSFLKYAFNQTFCSLLSQFFRVHPVL